ncbi:MAG: ferrous iron transporter B, partial [Caldilineaceae bacterium]|nr:ferrous iron transporter B [Caldilineaceae bacterium]
TVNLLPGADLSMVTFLGDGATEEDLTGLQSGLRTLFTPLAAVAFAVFVLLYTPCMATLAAMRQEFGLRWTLGQIAYTLLVAWTAAVLVYQGGLLLGLGG